MRALYCKGVELSGLQGSVRVPTGLRSPLAFPFWGSKLKASGPDNPHDSDSPPPA